MKPYWNMQWSSLDTYRQYKALYDAYHAEHEATPEEKAHAVRRMKDLLRLNEVGLQADKGSKDDCPF